MRNTIEETGRRREKQIKYNTEHSITPKTIFKSKEEIIKQSGVLDIRSETKPYVEEEAPLLAADPVVQYMSKSQLEKTIEATRSKMLKAARETDYMEAARLRDEMYLMQKLKLEKFGE